MSKTIKTERRLIQFVYQGLKNVPPKDYPTTAEIKSTVNEVLPALEEHIKEYTVLFERAIKVNRSLTAGDMAQKEADVLVDKLNNELIKYGKEHGEDIVEIKLSEGASGTLSEQIDRDGGPWGKNWFNTIDDFTLFSGDVAGKEREDKKEVKEEKKAV